MPLDDIAGEDGLELDDLIGRLDAFQLFRNNDDAQADAVLADLGATSGVDRDIVLELGATRPLAHPARFPQAHALAVRSLEVLDRNGHRSIPVPKALGFLSVVAQFLVQLVTQYLVRQYLANAIDSMRRLYIRREAATEPGDVDRPLLTRARHDVERLTPGFKRSKLGLPTFLFGGAILSALGGLIADLISGLTSNVIIRAITFAVLFFILVIATWVIVHGTAVARRRIRLTTAKPLDALWQTIGRCGDAPKDQGKAFAVIAIILTVASFVIIPVGIGLSFL